MNIISQIRLRLSRIGGGTSRNATLLRGSFGSACVQVTGRVLALAIGIVLARNLGARGFGIYAYSMAWLAIIAVLSEAGASTILIRGIASFESKEHWEKLRGLIVRVMQFVTLTSLVFVVIAALAIWSARNQVSDDMRMTLVLALVLLPIVVFGKAGAAIIIGLRHAVEGDFAENVFRPGVFLCLAVIAFGVFSVGQSPQNAMGLQVVAGVFSLILLMALVRRYLPKSVHNVSSARDSYGILSSSASLTLLAGAGLINGQTDILMLGFFRPAEDLGVYRVATQGAALVPIGLQITSVVFAPHIAAAYSDNDQGELQFLVTKSARIILFIAVPVVLMFLLFGGEIATFLFGDDFARVHWALAILSVGLLLNAATGPVGVVLRMTGHEKDSARIMIGSAFLNILLNFLFIPKFGIEGAAVATAFSFAASHFALWWVVRTRLGIYPTAIGLRRATR